jgi:hypothetical protein
MRRSIGVLACVAAVAALVGSATASAAGPNWLECRKATGGTLEKGCNAEGGKGGYEAAVGVGKGKMFKGKGTNAVLHTVLPVEGDVRVDCSTIKDSGIPVAPNRVRDVVLQLGKCKSLGSPCQNEGGKKEVITSSPLSGYLGWMDKAHTKPGLELTSEAEPYVGYTAEFECTSLTKVRVHGVDIGEIVTEGRFSKLSTSIYTVGPYLGEVSPGYTPLVNEPAFEEGAEPVGVLMTELNGGETGGVWAPEGGLPSGIEETVLLKGEYLNIG